ncbi:MAG: hypothetical protein AVDCRST_MAG01-01-4604, partial [uncultured Rubrobacteraceae bacterium]
PARHDGGRHYRLGRGGRARDRAPDGGAARPRDRCRRGRSGALPPRPRPLPPQDDRVLGPQAPLRGLRVLRRGRRRAFRVGDRALRARPGGAGDRDSLGIPLRRQARPPGRAHTPRTPRSLGYPRSGL